MLAAFITPFFTENAVIFLQHLCQIPGVRWALISQDSAEKLPPALAAGLAGLWRVEDCLQLEQLTQAFAGLSRKLGTIERVLAANEQVQVQAAQLRARFSLPGMEEATARRFRDKNEMKQAFRQAGVECARSRAVATLQEAREFVEQVGFPVCLKPVDGAATQGTFRVEDRATLEALLASDPPSPSRVRQLEEFIVGDEHSFETITLEGQPLWHSLTHYVPGPLEVVRNPWIQYQVILPREVENPRYDDIRHMGRRALEALGIRQGLSHMEWFRRQDGSVAINEVAARPPGVQIMPLINRAHDVDFYVTWGRLMLFDEFVAPPERKYAAGCAFLRGQGEGRVVAVQGFEQVLQEFSHLITDYKRPPLGAPKAISYEGEGYVILRHPETQVVAETLGHIVSRVRTLLQ